MVVVSLNCAGGNIQAAREVIDYNPDIVFLQESPVKEEVERFAYTLFMEHAVIAYGPDTSIIARGKLQQTALPEPVNIFMTLACIQLKSGHDIQIASIRLQPPVIEENLFSGGCWQRHYKDRKSRRKQLARAFEQLDYVHKG